MQDKKGKFSHKNMCTLLHLVASMVRNVKLSVDVLRSVAIETYLVPGDVSHGEGNDKCVMLEFLQKATKKQARTHEH